MTRSQHSTFPPTDAAPTFSTVRANYEAKAADYHAYLLRPALNQLRAAYGIESEPLPDRPPVTLEEVVAARKEYEALEASRAELWALCHEEPRPCKRKHGPRKPTLASVAKQASAAALDVARYEVRPDGTVVVVIGAGEQQQGNEVDEWIAKHADKTQGH